MRENYNKQVYIFSPGDLEFLRFLKCVFIYLLFLSVHLPKGIYSNFGPDSESDTDYFTVSVYSAASPGAIWILLEKQTPGQKNKH